jgi:hypothetical protein
VQFDLGSIVGLIATVAGLWLGTRIIKPRDHERAAALDAIAKGATALVISLNPTAKWAELIKQIVSTISSSAGLPTANKDAIERAAAAALVAAGKAPGV